MVGASRMGQRVKSGWIAVATLLVVWLTLNSCLTALFLFDGTLVPSLPRLVLYLPLLVVGVLLGEFLHHRLNEQRFRQVVYGLLVLTGALLIFKALEGYSGSMLS